MGHKTNWSSMRSPPDGLLPVTHCQWSAKYTQKTVGPMKNLCLTWWSPVRDTKTQHYTKKKKIEKSRKCWACGEREMKNRNHLNEIQRKKSPARNPLIIWTCGSDCGSGSGYGCGSGSASGTISLTRTMKPSEWKITIVTTANRFFIARRETFHGALKLIWK